MQVKTKKMIYWKVLFLWYSSNTYAGQKSQMVEIDKIYFVTQKYISDDKTHSCCKGLLAKTHTHDCNASQIS